jgi:hypothetical protein
VAVDIANAAVAALFGAPVAAAVGLVTSLVIERRKRSEALSLELAKRRATALIENWSKVYAYEHAWDAFLEDDQIMGMIDVNAGADWTDEQYSEALWDCAQNGPVRVMPHSSLRSDELLLGPQMYKLAFEYADLVRMRAERKVVGRDAADIEATMLKFRAQVQRYLPSIETLS